MNTLIACIRFIAIPLACVRSTSVPLVRPIPPTNGQAQGYSTGGTPLIPDQRGLALLRSPALRDRPVRTIAVVGQARTGKSFFLNSVASSGAGGGDGCSSEQQPLFEVNATTEGLTKGIWLHHWRGAGATNAANGKDSSMTCGNPVLPGDASAADDEEEGGGGVATLLLDTEGLGAPGGDLKGYDSKLVRAKEVD